MKVIRTPVLELQTTATTISSENLDPVNLVRMVHVCLTLQILIGCASLIRASTTQENTFSLGIRMMDTRRPKLTLFSFAPDEHPRSKTVGLIEELKLGIVEALTARWFVRN